jgi:IS5 family transposase
MMGRPQRAAAKLFYIGWNLDQRVRADHPLRAIRAALDFDFVRPLVRSRYGRRGNPSVDPALLLKLMFLLFYEQVPSERALMARLSERLDWLWFCGLDLDSEIPNHSVISKARKRWGTEVFAEFFGRVLDQCVQAGLVDGTFVHVDSSLVAANADRTKLQTVLRLACREFYERLEHESVESGEPKGPPGASPAGPPAAPEPSLGSAVSPTDPDARLIRKNGQTTLGYKGHRVVDDRCGIITATATTPASVHDGAMLMGLLEGHQESTGQKAEAVAADSMYGTGENYEELREQGVRPAIPHQVQKGAPGKFGRDQFRYEATNDCYVCPAGQEMHRVGRAPKRDHWEYRAGRKVCRACPLRRQCTGETGRTFKRHVHQEAIDWADGLLPEGVRRRMLRRRRIRAEGSFADALRHGFKRARWRGLGKMTIQNLLIAAIQNVRKLVKYARKGRGAGILAKNLCLLVQRMTGWSHWMVQRLTELRDDPMRLEFAPHA